MMRALLAVVLCWLILALPASAQIGGSTGIGAPAASGGSSGECAAATAFLARNGNAHPQITTALICGMQAVGVGCSAWPGASGSDPIDAMYVLATTTAGNAQLNICSTSNTLTVGAPTCTFTADQGYACDGTAGYLDTNLNPASGSPKCGIASCSFGAYVLTSVDTGSVIGQGSASGSNVYSYLAPFSGSTIFTAQNMYGGVGAAGSASTPSAVGAWISNRSGAAAAQGYKNGSSTPVFTDTSGTGSLTIFSNTFKIAATTLGAGGTPQYFSADQIAAVFIGGSMTGAMAAALNDLINAYMAGLPTPRNIY